MKIVTLISGLLLMLLYSSCTTNKGGTTQVLQSEITLITAPETAISNSDVKIKVDFWGPDGCSTAYNIKADKVGQTITLRAYYQHNDESACTLALVPLSLEYSFFADLPGPYFFISADNNNIADTLVVY